jgi:hypothetical protein
MVKNSNSNNNIMTAKQKVGEKLELRFRPYEYKSEAEIKEIAVEIQSMLAMGT